MAARRYAEKGGPDLTMAIGRTASDVTGACEICGHLRHLRKKTSCGQTYPQMTQMSADVRS
jgi:hypothetical protein